MSFLNLQLRVLLLILLAVANPAQCYTSEQPAFSIESQPNAPIALENLKGTVNPEFPSLFDVTFRIVNRGGKRTTNCSLELESIKTSGGGASMLHPCELEPNESMNDGDVSVTVKGKPYVLRVNWVRFEDGTEWKAPTPEKKKN